MGNSYRYAYDTNADVKEYVDKYSTQYRISVDEALTHSLVRSVINYKEEKDGIPNRINSSTGNLNSNDSCAVQTGSCDNR